MKYKRTISIRISQESLEMIKEIQKCEELKKWNPTVSEIIRVAITNYWEDMCLPFKKT